MALFSKKITLDDILKTLDELPEDQRDKVRAKVEDLYKAEDEREIDEIEEKKADDASESDEKSEEASEESEEIGKDVDEIEEEAAEGGDETAEEAEEQKEKDEGQNDALAALTARIEALSESHGKLEELVNSIVDNFDKRGFGNARRGAPAGEPDSDSGESAVMRGYNSKQTNFRS